MAARQSTRDFVDVVEGYLDRGEVYQPAEKFVSELSLCQRCRGGPDQMKLLRDLISRMASLVREKMANQRNRKRLQEWRRKVAKDLDTFQIVSRDWINHHVWDLGALPKSMEQNYDPMAGRRDYRFYPSTDKQEQAVYPAANQPEQAVDPSVDQQEQALLDATGEDMGTELNYCATEDEDKLLYSPSRSTVRSKSPQVSLFPSPTSIAKFSSATLTSPRSNKAPQLQDPSSSQMDVFQPPASPLAVSCSPARVSRSDRRNNSPQRHQRDLGKDRPLRRKYSRSSDTRTKQARSGHSRDRRHLRQWDGSRACSSLSSAVSPDPSGSTSGPTQGLVASTGFLMSAKTDDANQNTYTQGMVVSTGILVKASRDELIQNVHQGVTERRETEVGKQKKRNSRCWVPGCTADARYLKAHAFYDHLPSIFDERLEPSDERILCGRRIALKQAGRWLMGRPVELDQLLTFVTIQRLLSQTDNTEVTQRQATAMQEFCRFLHEPIPEQFILEPGNSVGILLHWKALLLVAASLTEEEREYWRANFHALDLTEEVEVQQVVSPRIDLPAFDSHFHLDRTLRKMHLPADGNVDDILQRAPVEDNKRISMVGAIAIYCDPDTYPSERYLDLLPEFIGVGIGYHPKHATDSRAKINEEVRHLRRLLRHPRIVALGEVGLDHSEPHRNWSYQLDLLEKVLLYLEDRHVLVIHCRAMEDDCGTEVYLLLLRFLRKKVRHHQPIHLHCFAGNSYVLRRWLDIFPRTYFGFTNMVKKFDRDQIKALCEIDENRLLLESDAPYFPIEGQRVSSPSQLYVLAETIAEHRQLTVERILEVTVANARHLYQEDQ